MFWAWWRFFWKKWLQVMLGGVIQIKSQIAKSKTVVSPLAMLFLFWIADEKRSMVFARGRASFELEFVREKVPDTKIHLTFLIIPGSWAGLVRPFYWFFGEK